MDKQTKRMNAEAAATAEATSIIKEATRKVADSKPQQLAKATKALAPDLLAKAEAIKAARAEGEAWWRIAHILGLPGSADTVVRGKAGAGLARRIYVTAFGALPERVVSTKTKERRSRSVEKDPTVKALKAEQRADRVAKVRAGGGCLPNDLPEAELLATLKGREITWSVNLADLDGGTPDYRDETATVHPKFLKVEMHGGERCIAFKEFDTNSAAIIDGRITPGKTRVVRVSRIHTIK